jgi:hypothetical protein
MDNQEFNCKECQTPFLSERSLHAHIKVHKLPLAEYYVKHYPRADLLTGEPIAFKNKEKYFDTDFSNKNNLKKWLKTQPPEFAKDYCKNLLVKRINKKSLQFTPTQIELRSIMCPPVSFFVELFGDYNVFCESLGLKPRFVKTTPCAPRKVEHINVDTREQSVLKFNLPVQVTTLQFGDYSCDGSNTFFERKSLTDFIGTLGGGFERFTNEIERAGVNGAKLVVIVEDTFEHAMSFPHLPWISKKIRVMPEAIFHNVRDILQKYNHVQFLFVSGRPEAVRIIEKIYQEGIPVNQFDLQLNYDLGKL